MRNMNQLAAVGAVGAVLFAGAAQTASATCDPQARQLFIDRQLLPDKHFRSWVLQPHNPETTTIVVREKDNPSHPIDNPGVIECHGHTVDYFGLEVELIGDKTYISTALLPAANAEVSQAVGLHSTPVKNPERAGLLVQRTLHLQFDDVYGFLGFTNGDLTFGLMP